MLHFGLYWNLRRRYNSETELCFMHEGASVAMSLGLKTSKQICEHLSEYFIMHTLQEEDMRRLSQFMKVQENGI
jgi:hypothetical protein